MKNLKGQDYNTQTSLFDERRTQSGEKSQRKDKLRNRIEFPEQTSHS